MTLKANRVKWLRRTVLPQRSQCACPPAPPPPPRVARGDYARRLPGFDPTPMTRGWSCLRASFCSGGSSAFSDAVERRGWRRPVAQRSVSPARPCAVSAAPPVVRWCAARPSDGPSGGRRATPAKRRRCRGGGGTPFFAPRAPRHGNVAVRAPVRARGRSGPAFPVSMRRPARHRPEGQGIARTCLEFFDLAHDIVGPTMHDSIGQHKASEPVGATISINSKLWLTSGHIVWQSREGGIIEFCGAQSRSHDIKYG